MSLEKQPVRIHSSFKSVIFPRLYCNPEPQANHWPYCWAFGFHMYPFYTVKTESAPASADQAASLAMWATLFAWRVAEVKTGHRCVMAIQHAKVRVVLRNGTAGNGGGND